MTQTVKLGVPQGSVLGALLFLIYIGVIGKGTEYCDNVIGFADDTTIFDSNKSIANLEVALNKSITDLVQYFNNNNLFFVIGKSSVLHFSAKNKLNNKVPKIKFNNEILEEARSTKFLGVRLDNRLNWNDHITEIERKLSKQYLL